MHDFIEPIFHPGAHPRFCLNALQHLGGWRDRATAAEKNRRLSASTFTELFSGDWLDLMSPRAPVIHEGNWPSLVESARVAARGCASTGWMLALVGGHGSIVRRLPAACQDQLYSKGSRQLFASASSSGESRLSLETAGMRVNGRWRFSSGVDDASWLLLNAPCHNHPDATRTPRFLVLVETRDVQRLDSWDSSGMAATGSHDVLTEQLLVPHDRIFALHEIFAADLNRQSEDYIDRLPLVPYLTTSIIGPLLGCAEGAHAAYIASMASSAEIADARVSEQAAHSAAQLFSAQLLYHSLISRLHDAGCHGRELDPGQLLLLKRDRAYLAQQCVEVVRRLVERLGASSLVGGNPLHRHWRDIQTMAAHRDVAWSDAMFASGESALRPV